MTAVGFPLATPIGGGSSGGVIAGRLRTQDRLLWNNAGVYRANWVDAPLVDLTAFLKGIRRGVEVYYKLRGLESRHRPPPRRVADEDEHLFI